MIFVGSNQSKLPTSFAIAAQALGASVEYVQIEGNGRNALDFLIAFYLRSASAATRTGEWVVISKDTGFDPLILHIKNKGISCRRLTSLGDVPGLKEAAAKPVSKPIQRVLANFAKRPAGRPRTAKTLRSTIKNLLGKETTDETVNQLTGELEGLNEIKVTDEKVIYPP